MEINRKYFFYSGLALLFIFTFLTSFTITSNAFFSQRLESTGIITLGRSNVMFSTGSVLFENVSVAPGETLSYPVKVINALNAQGTNTTGLIDCYLRVGISYLSNGENADIVTANLTNSNDWLVHSDGFLYYKSVFSVGQEVQIFSSFTFSSQITESQAQYGVTISIEAQTVQADGITYHSVWPTAPNLF